LHCDQIEEAIKAYEKEDYNMAITALDAASTLIRQKKGELVNFCLNHLAVGKQEQLKAARRPLVYLVVELVPKDDIHERTMARS